MILSRDARKLPHTTAIEANRLAVGNRSKLTGKEVVFGADQVIVSKTDAKGIITYANRTFLTVSGYSQAELLGAPHSILRHPDMPRCVFKFLWDNITAGQELFAYVLNKTKQGDHYWVHAHVTPSKDGQGNIIGYHSNRRFPERTSIDKIAPLYAKLLATEKAASTPQLGLEDGTKALLNFVGSTGMSYSELFFTL